MISSNAISCLDAMLPMLCYNRYAGQSLSLQFTRLQGFISLLAIHFPTFRSEMSWVLHKLYFHNNPLNPPIDD
jgi:hypothetical protein